MVPHWKKYILRKNILKLCIAVLVLLPLFLIDSSNYTYAWKRLVYGVSLNNSGLELSPGFFVNSKDDGTYFIVEKGYLEYPLLVTAHADLPYVDLLNQGLLEIYKEFHSCIVYKNPNHKNHIYIYIFAFISCCPGNRRSW